MTEYALDNSWEKAQRRLAGLEALADPGTIRHLESLGVGEGWTCLEAGAGRGSIAEWLCDRVGPTGTVVAADINTTLLERIDRPNLDIQRLDILTDELPTEAFDLVHARAIISHLPQPRTAIEKLVGALAPTGNILIEEFDFVTSVPDPTVAPEQQRLFGKLMDAHNAILDDRMNVHYGRRLVHDLRSAGVRHVETEGRAYHVRGGTPGALAYALTFEQLSDEIVDRGLATPSEVQATIEILQDPSFALQSMMIIAAWGHEQAA